MSSLELGVRFGQCFLPCVSLSLSCPSLRLTPQRRPLVASPIKVHPDFVVRNNLVGHFYGLQTRLSAKSFIAKAQTFELQLYLGPIN